MIYCVVPQALADDLYDRLADYYRDDPNVEVIVDRRAQGGDAGHAPAVQRSPAPAAQGQLPADRTPVPELKVVVHVDGGRAGTPAPLPWAPWSPPPRATTCSSAGATSAR